MTELVLDQAAIKKFSQSDAGIARMAKEYMPLKINGVDDKKGFDIVHKARMDVKNHRVAVEKKRKELKADALEYGRKVDSEAKRLTAMLKPIEDHLQAEEQAVLDERERIRKEKEEAEQRRVQHRVERLAEFGVVPNLNHVKHWTDAEFDDALIEARKAFEEEQARKAKEEEERRQREAEEAEARRKEQERLDAERAKLDAERREMEAKRKAEEEERRKREAAERAKLDEERRKLEAERAKIEQERREREAAERAKREEQERIKSEQEAEARRKAEEEAERKRQEALRPDREKLEALAHTVSQVDIPKLSKERKHLEVECHRILLDASNQIAELIDREVAS